MADDPATANESWMSLVDPFAEAWAREGAAIKAQGASHDHGHGHGH